MAFDEAEELQLQHLAGGSIVTYPPLFAIDEEYLFIIHDNVVNVYSTTTCQITRKLTGSASNIIGMQLELTVPDTLVCCAENGEVFRWKWRSGKLEKNLLLMLPPHTIVSSFNLINFYDNSDTACAFITIKQNQKYNWYVVDTTIGKIHKIEIPVLHLRKIKPLVSASSNENFRFIVVSSSHYIHFVNYENWKCNRLSNAHNRIITAIRTHPNENLVATGDSEGRIFLWRNVDQPKPVTTLLHWHHTPITCLAFSTSGSYLFSGGEEAVLVKWTLADTLKKFVPRMNSKLCHIAVNTLTNHLAVCTKDNAVHIVGNENKIIKALHEFTYIVEEKTNRNKFPIGLLLNPRTNALALNGRIGHIQFYSAYSRSLLYNMDITRENMHSEEAHKILYNICVTKADFNIDWLATGEEYNDEVHLPELRLKFWEYQEESQTYVLNTNVELAHEEGFTAIKFSSDARVGNLLCATVGKDNVIKIWTLDNSENIYKSGKVWFCICETSYKNMPIESVCFSEDGSILAAGFGNTLCIYKADTLKLKVALNSSGCIDGNVYKAQICLPKGKNINSPEQTIDRKKILEVLSNKENTSMDVLVAAVRKSLSIKSELPQAPKGGINDKQKEELYNKIQQMNELNVFQKLLIYQRLGICCRISRDAELEMVQYIRNTICNIHQKQRVRELHNDVLSIGSRSRFKAKLRLRDYTLRRNAYRNEVNDKLVPILSLLGLNQFIRVKPSKKENVSNEKKTRENPLRQIDIIPPTPVPSQIRHVQFAANELAHLVVVCTESRVLIWNLLNLRVQSCMKISVKHLALDPLSNKIAAFTKYNDLYIIQPNVGLPIYHRKNLPSVCGATWLPRRRPKERSILIDWQAFSTLYFLTESQSLMFLGTVDDLPSDAPPPISLLNPEESETLRYSTFGTYVMNRMTNKQMKPEHQQFGPLIFKNTGKDAVKSLVEMSTHTMPPMSLLCSDFVKSFAKPLSPKGDSMKTTTKEMQEKEVEQNRQSDNEDDDDDEENETLKKRQQLLGLIERKDVAKNTSKSSTEKGNPSFEGDEAELLEARLTKISQQEIFLYPS